MRFAIVALAASLASVTAFNVPAAIIRSRSVAARLGWAGMAGGTPQVPWKAPGMEIPQWIDIYNRMYRERIMFVGQPIEDNFANTIIAVLLYLESEDANSPVAMYFNSPGGVMKSGLAMYDTMRIMPYDIQTVNMGICAQVSAFLVAGGTKGKRYALPNSRFAMQNPGIIPPMDDKGNPIMRPMQATEMQLEVQETLRDKKRMLEGFSKFTGRSVELLEQDFLRDFYLSADEAVQYGMVDQLLLPKRPDTAASPAFEFPSFQAGASGTESTPRDDPPLEAA